VHILSDEIYEYLIYPPYTFISFLAAAPDLKDRTFTVNGVSKGFSMTGWRIGFGAGHPALIQAISTLQSQSTTNPTSISQWAALEAFNGTRDFLPHFVQSFQERRDYMIDRLNHIPGLSCKIPDGAFYVYVKCQDVLRKTTPSGKKIANDLDFTEYLLEEAGVAVVPGTGFGLSPYFRASYATSLELLTKACNRIETACRSLR
jgi:aspartate aminotransferase